MFPSEIRLFALLDTLRDELSPTLIFEPRISTGPLYREAIDIFIAYPGASLITISLFQKQGQLVARVIPRGFSINELTQTIMNSVSHILQLILPNVNFTEHPYRRNVDDEFRNAQRRWKVSGLEEDQKRYENIARRAGLCPKCEDKLSEDACQICDKSPCENCDVSLHCERCGVWVCEDCQRQCTHCGMAYCYKCIEKCSHCKKDFCKPGFFSLTEGRFVNAPSCLPPGPDGHGCPDWDEQEED